MFTWNFQYISKARLRETFVQLMLDSEKDDILVRIHTSIHLEEEAVDLARFIKTLVPTAHIIGTSTQAAISWGRLVKNQCMISVSRIAKGQIYSGLFPEFTKNEIEALEEKKDQKLLLCFLSGGCEDPLLISESIGEKFGILPVAGGIATTPGNSYREYRSGGFVFDETGYSEKGAILALLCGEDLESAGGYVTGAQIVGEPLSDDDGIPELVRFTDDGKRIFSDYASAKGKRVSMAFLHDGKIASEDRTLFQRIENFQRAETVFGYSCKNRVEKLPNSSGWELSAYENSNICGCVLDGLLTHDNGRCIYSDYAFAVCALGEEEATQKYNPYVFAHTDPLSSDNRPLLSFLMETEKTIKDNGEQAVSSELRKFVTDCEKEILVSAREGVPNGAALNMDMKLRGHDRICMINVSDVNGMEAVFPESVVRMTQKNYVQRCAAFSRARNYHIYLIGKWQLCIAAPSYEVKLSDYIRDMEELQKELFRTTEETVAIVPTFCIMDGCDPDSLSENYYSARTRMERKNLQFYVYDAESDRLDEEQIRKSYHMVDVINYAIANDRVIPYYQGIYDNRAKKISHYEALMRIEDENGKLYMPGDFLEVARSYGLLYDNLSMTMIEKVFEKFRNLANISVSINLSLRDIRNREIVEYICDFLTTAEHPGNFIFEILENEDMDEYGEMLDFVDRIHLLGGRIAIDDFGSGYSNLMHVVNIHTDFLKIDGSIVRKCGEAAESENMIALIAGWRRLSARNIGIIAEFVENETIQKKLDEYGIEYSQGYLYARPKPEIEED
ncbi:MAG: EAL domain-containing protein [Lachnospiraceae bacterium]|nr:EAL domain-containing protein [Lachnospiraceae bacterium]